MPIDTFLCQKVWGRYAWCRDNGHAKYVQKADLCERMFAGDQWDANDKASLAAARRPALTINKIMSTIANVAGEQIYNRAETSFRPRNGGTAASADILNKVFKQISDNNQLDWKRSDMFLDGVIGSRGFLDIRMGYDDNMRGEVRYENINPKNVVVDPDAEEYDPDSWSEVFVTKWVTADDIAVLYGADEAELLRNRDTSSFAYGYDSIETYRDRFGERFSPQYTGNYEQSSVLRNIRIIDRQHRMLHEQKHFVEVETGDMRPIPVDFDRNRIAFFVEKFGFRVIKKHVRRIRWTVIADNVLLHDDWSPYKHFTVVPYFPHFRYGRTIGLVENLAGPQELLNKVTSQELHVLNTTANSGWKIKKGALTNMTMEELEQKGSMTGLVLELTDMEGAEKITANSTPQGLDRMSYKAEESIKTISGVPDSVQGMDRADVAAKAIEAKKKAASTNLVKPMDQLTRTDYFIARNTLDLVQEFYTAPMVMTITADHATGETESFEVNQVNEETGEVLNDLTLGEYGVIVTSVPHRETMEDSQFEQAVSLRELGVKIPDSVLIDSSRLQNKRDIVKQIADAENSDEAKQQRQLAMEGAAAEVAKTQGEASVKRADAGLKQAKTAETIVKTHTEAQGEPGQADDIHVKEAQAAHKMDLDEQKFEHQKQMDFRGLRMKAADQDQKNAILAKNEAEKRVTERKAAARSAQSGKVHQ